MRPTMMPLLMLLTAAAFSAPAFADPFPAAGRVQAWALDEAIADGTSGVTVHALVIGPEGTPVGGLKLKASTGDGEVGEVVEVSPGLYAVEFVPGVATAAREATVQFKGKTADRTPVEASTKVRVLPSAAAVLQGVASPPQLVLGQDTEATISFSVPDTVAAGVSAEDLMVKVSSGELVNLTHMGGGTFTGRYLVPKVNYPHLAILTFADRRDPSRRYGATVIPLLGKVDYPVQASPNATVLLEVGGRQFGPVNASPQGQASVPIVVPPGTATARQTTVVDGESREQSLDLQVPETPRVHLLPMSASIPSNDELSVPVRMFVVKPDGSPDTDASVNVTATAGRVSPALHEANGIYVARFTPPDGRTQMTATVQVSVPGTAVQSDSADVTLLPAMPERVELSAEPELLQPGGTGLRVFARATAGDGTGLPNLRLDVVASGASLKEIVDLKGGDYRVDFTAESNSAVDVWVAARPVASANKAANVLILPADRSVPADGVSNTPVHVVTVDEFGYAVPGIAVTLSVAAGDGGLPLTATTDSAGVAQVFFTSGSESGVVMLQGEAAGRVGTAAILQGATSEPIAMPLAGNAERGALTTAWEALVQKIHVPREGAEDAPVIASIQVGGAEAVAGLQLTAEPATVAPGGKVLVRVSARDAAGVGVGGTAPDLFATAGGRFGLIRDLGDGTYEADLTVPSDAKGTIKVSALVGAANGVLEIPVADGSAPAVSPWAEGQPEGSVADGGTESETAAPEETAKKKKSGSDDDRPFLRMRAGAVFSSYAYTQSPEGDFALLPSELSWGGESGGAATPLGFEVAVRGFVPSVPYIGWNVSYRLARYSVSNSTFDAPAKDSLHNVRAEAVGRVPIKLGDNSMHVGVSAGFRMDDIVTFSGCLDPLCEVIYEPVLLPGLGVGAEVGAEVWKLYGLLSYTQGFAYATVPYANQVDLNLGFQITKNIFVDGGFGFVYRKVTLEGQDSGIARGEIRDRHYLGTVSVGASF